MSLFGKKNNSNENKKKEIQNKTGIKILGSGCSKCNELEKNTKEAMNELGIDEEIDHVTDFSIIAMYGVMTTPALVRDGKVLSYGRVLSKDEIKRLFTK